MMQMQNILIMKHISIKLIINILKIDTVFINNLYNLQPDFLSIKDF